jgi:hypothetical protein
MKKIRSYKGSGILQASRFAASARAHTLERKASSFQSERKLKPPPQLNQQEARNNDPQKKSLSSPAKTVRIPEN